MSYYNTAREHVKSLKAMQESASRRSERRTELAGVSVYPAYLHLFATYLSMSFSHESRQ